MPDHPSSTSSHLSWQPGPPGGAGLSADAHDKDAWSKFSPSPSPSPTPSIGTGGLASTSTSQAQSQSGFVSSGSAISGARLRPSYSTHSSDSPYSSPYGIGGGGMNGHAYATSNGTGGPGTGFGFGPDSPSHPASATPSRASSFSNMTSYARSMSYPPQDPSNSGLFGNGNGNAYGSAWTGSGSSKHSDDHHLAHRGSNSSLASKLHGNRSKAILIWGMRFGWVVLIIWGEIGEFFSSISECHFPDSQIMPASSASPFRLGTSNPSTSSSSPGDNTPTHVLLISDPQIPHETLSYPDRSRLLQKLTTYFIDLYMRKAWNVIMRLGRIDHVIFGGDMMDVGRANIDDQEYARYLARFRSIFKVPDDVKQHFVPGNHDIGLGPHRFFSPRAKERYAENFTPPNALVSIANHTFILLDAVTLVEEDYRRYAAEVQLGEWDGVQGGVIEFIKDLGRDKPPAPRILISHIPLARPEQSSCGPLREKGRILKGAGIGYQNLLGSETSRFLLHNLEPAMVFSGDDHDYCEYTHPNGVREVTLKAFSMAMGINRPGFQLLSLVPPSGSAVRTSVVPPKTFADVPCLLPDQFEIYFKHYIPFALLSIIVLFYINLKSAVEQHGGWSALSARDVKQFLSPMPSPGATPNPNRQYKKEKVVPLTLPSRRSSQNLAALQMSNVTPSPSKETSSSSRLRTVTPVRRITKSAPVSPAATPRGYSQQIDDEEMSHNDHDVYGNASARQSRTDLSEYGDVESGMTEEPSSYFLPLPEKDRYGGLSVSPIGPSTPGLTMQSRRPTASRRLTRPSDWVSAARAKDMTVVELMFDQSPAKSWFKKERLRTIYGWMRGRQGIIAVTMRDIWGVALPIVVFWVGLNATFFL